MSSSSEELYFKCEEAPAGWAQLHNTSDAAGSAAAKRQPLAFNSAKAATPREVNEHVAGNIESTNNCKGVNVY